MKPILVVGAGGQVGRALASRSRPGERPVVALTRNSLDITDLAAVRAAVAMQPFAAIINAAAYTAVDRAESESAAAFAINRDGPRNLAIAAAEQDIPLLHISTDYVFDGLLDRPYLETDAVGPTGVYGASKLAGEAMVRDYQPRHIILRTSWVYAPANGNFVATMLRLAATRPELRVVDDQRGGPTEAGDIADALLAIVAQLGHETPWGTYHFSGAPAISWCGFARAIVMAAAPRLAHVPALTAITTDQYPTAARRPANSVLDCRKIAARFGIAQPDWRLGLGAIVGAIQDLMDGPAVTKGSD